MRSAEGLLRTPEELHQITERNNTESPLFSLPAELRNTIYEHLLTGHIWDIGWDGRARTQVKHVFGLLGVCRKIYLEARMYPWSGSTFCVVDPQHMGNLASGIPPAFRAAITSVNLNLFTTWKHAEKSVDFRFCMSDWITWDDMSFTYLSGLQRFRVTVEIDRADLQRSLRIYGESTTMNKYYRLLADISGEMLRAHPGKMTFDVNTDSEHMRHLFHK